MYTHLISFGLKVQVQRGRNNNSYKQAGIVSYPPGTAMAQTEKDLRREANITSYTIMGIGGAIGIAGALYDVFSGNIKKVDKAEIVIPMQMTPEAIAAQEAQRKKEIETIKANEEKERLAAEEKRKEEEERAAALAKITSQFIRYHGEDEFSTTFSNLSNPYAFEKEHGYYLEHVIPSTWVDNKTYIGHCMQVSLFGDKKSSPICIDIGEFKPSDISKNTVMGTDFGQILIVKPDGVYGVFPKFKLVYILVKSGIYI